MLQIINQLPKAQCNEIRAHLTQLDDNLIKDVSKYAPGRMRYWLNWEWDLKNKQLKPGVQDERLWNFCQHIYPGCNLGLVAKGSVGIDWHRDDSYAQFKAVTINLGSTLWGYDREYPEFKWVPDAQKLKSNPIIYQLNDGDVIEFCCKNKHAAINPDPDRYSINLWKLKPDIAQRAGI